MSSTTNLSTFTVPLASKAHELAKHFHHHHANSQKAKQVYLNTLAVYAVNYYLQCLGIETNLPASHSQNSVMQTLMDVADLPIDQRGVLECRPVLPDEQICHIPPEARDDRIGVVLVQLNEALTEATLLGFNQATPEGELSVSQLRSLDELPEFLDHLTQPAIVNQIASATWVNLGQWLQNLFEIDWQPIDALLSLQPGDLAFRLQGDELVTDLDTNYSRAGVGRAKLISLDSALEMLTVAFIAWVAPSTSSEKEPLQPKTGVCFQIYPVDQRCLPSGVKLRVLSEAGDVLQEVQSRSIDDRGIDDYMQKHVIGLPGERFKIEVAFGDTSVVEQFVI